MAPLDDRPGDAATDDDLAAGRFPGAQAPDRVGFVDSFGVRIATYEWGDAEAPPLFLAHGGFDFARTFSGFAPRLAAAGFRVVAWDQRGHGDSDHSALYSWEADVRDAVMVMDSVTRDPAPLLGHSKGGGIALQLASAQPWRVSKIVNLDGVPSRRPMPDVAEHERTKMFAGEMTSWLDHRRTTATSERKAGTLQELAERRSRMNPRLSLDWLRFLVTVGARRDADGWRWKLDPSMRFGGFGPWRPEWSLQHLATLPVPILGVLATIDEPLGWGTKVSDLVGCSPHASRFVSLEDTGHFVHVERPDTVAELALEFLS